MDKREKDEYTPGTRGWSKHLAKIWGTMPKYGGGRGGRGISASGVSPKRVKSKKVGEYTPGTRGWSRLRDRKSMRKLTFFHKKIKIT